MVLIVGGVEGCGVVDSPREEKERKEDQASYFVLFETQLTVVLFYRRPKFGRIGTF